MRKRSIKPGYQMTVPVPDLQSIKSLKAPPSLLVSLMACVQMAVHGDEPLPN